MDRLDTLRRMLEHSFWADREALRSLERGGPPPGEALRLMNHIAGAGRLWLDRIKGNGPTLPVWPELGLESCRLELERLAADWKTYLAGLTEAGLSRAVAYTNSKDEPWANTVADILTHVALHGAYHRGQIAAALRASGLEPAYADYIHAVRSGFIGGE